MKRTVVGAILVLGSAAGCGQSQEAQNAEQAAASIQQGAQQAAEGAGAAAKSAEQGLQQMMQGLQQMAGQAQANAKPVDYELLKALVPELSGWERSNLKGQQTSMGFSVSSAEARYRKGDQSIKLEIIDTSFNQLLLAPIAMIARGFEEKSDTGYKKGMTLAGHPGLESWQSTAKEGEVHLIVANRFLINAEGAGVASVEPARQLVQAIDLAKLATLK